MRSWLCLLLILSGCTNGGPGSNSNIGSRQVNVVATTGMIADAARIVGGDRVQVDALMGPGVDPHQYAATPGDFAKLRSADLVLYNGLHLEGRMATELEKLGKRRWCVAVTKDLDVHTQLRPAPEGFEGNHDPHVWFDVSLWSEVVKTIGTTLGEIDPTHAADYVKRADAYREELLHLHAEVKAKAASVPAERRVLITAHDAFYYFGRAYEFEVRGLQGVSTASEFGTKDVQALAKLIGERKIPAIFGESSVPDRNLQAVVDAVSKTHGFQVNFVAGQLFSDALDKPDAPAGTYVGMVRHNIDTIVGALK